MKNSILVVAAVVASTMVLPVSAAEVKIAVVNLVKVVENSPQAKAASESLEKEFSARQKEIIDLQKSTRALEEKLAKEGASMPDAEAQKVEKDIIAKRKDLKKMQDEYREDLTARRSEALGKMQKDILLTVQGIAKDKGYDLVLGDALYVAPHVDITDEVLARLKEGSLAAADKPAGTDKPPATPAAPADSP